MPCSAAKAIDITTNSVERYKTLRLREKAAPATVNRELASLKRMFRLGQRFDWCRVILNACIVQADSGPAFVRNTKPLFGAQGDERIYPCRAACGYDAGNCHNHDNDSRHA